MLTKTLTPNDDINKILATINQPTTIYLTEGIYRQKIDITKNDIKIIGKSRETTVITYDNYARQVHEDGQEYNTFRTYTLSVSGCNVTIENLTIENSNTQPHIVGQCVALSVCGANFVGRNLDLRSMQDTLYLSPWPNDLVERYYHFLPHHQLLAKGHHVHHFENCRIYGTVDFIFGGSEAHFNNCQLISLHDERGTGYVCAPSHEKEEGVGFVFHHCQFLSQGAEDDSVFLARPWRDYGKCVFLDCTLAQHIKPELFNHWDGTTRENTCRMEYYHLTGRSIAPQPWSKELTCDELDIYRHCSTK